MANTHPSAFTAKKILLPTDFSSSSSVALDAACGLALQLHASIHIVHVIPEFPNFNGSDFFPITSVLQDREETIEEKLEGSKALLALEGVASSFSIETGNDIVGNLMLVIVREHVDMVVISTHGMSGWRPMVFGSIAEGVMKQVTCPLLLLQSSRHKSAKESVVVPLHSETGMHEGLEAAKAWWTAPKRDIVAQQRMDYVADDLAARSGRTEQAYDRAHPLFTK